MTKRKRLGWLAGACGCAGVGCMPVVEIAEAAGGAAGEDAGAGGGDAGKGGSVSTGGSSVGGSSGGSRPNPGGAGTGTGGDSAPVCNLPEYWLCPPITRVPWDGAGVLAPNAYGLRGGWFPFDDCDDARPLELGCTSWDSPAGGTGFVISSAKVCAKGVAARVELDPSGNPAWGAQWGAGIGFEFNQQGPREPGVNEPGPVRVPYDATAYGITGFIFDITGTAPREVTVNLPIPTTTAFLHFKVVPVPTLDATVLLSEVAQGSWATDPVPFTPDAIYGVNFQVTTNTDAEKPFDFCVSNFRVVRSSQ